MKRMVICSIVLTTTAAFGQTFDANGKRLDQGPQTQYQWTDPKTGKVVTKPYPPANLDMKQIEKRGNLVILEVIGHESKFADTVRPSSKPKDVAVLESNLPAKNCFDAVKRQLKDPYSAQLHSENGVMGFTAEPGTVRQTVTIQVNAKNSYGGYTGIEPYTCVLQMDNATVSYVKTR